MFRRLVSTARALGVLLVVMFVSGCAFSDHETVLNSAAAASPSDVGHGMKLYFRFVDDRDDVVLGHRGVGGNGGKITAAALPEQVELSLRDALTKKNFELVTIEAGSDASVVYRLRSFKFDLARGFFSGAESSAAALAVAAKRKDVTYDQVYRYNKERRAVVVPTGNKIDTQMNAGLTSVLQQAYDDAALDAFLVGH